MVRGYILVTCRIGSQETERLIEVEVVDVTCRIGSQE